MIFKSSWEAYYQKVNIYSIQFYALFNILFSDELNELSFFKAVKNWVLSLLYALLTFSSRCKVLDLTIYLCMSWYITW